MSYLCENCGFNNNGWCKINKFNGLKKKNIQQCESFMASVRNMKLNLNSYTTDELIQELRRRLNLLESEE